MPYYLLAILSSRVVSSSHLPERRLASQRLYGLRRAATSSPQSLLQAQTASYPPRCSGSSALPLVMGGAGGQAARGWQIQEAGSNEVLHQCLDDNGIVSNSKLCSRQGQVHAKDSIAVVWLVLPLLVQQPLGPLRSRQTTTRAFVISDCCSGTLCTSAGHLTCSNGVFSCSVITRRLRFTRSVCFNT